MDSILYPFAVAVAWLWVRIHDLLLLVGMNSGAGFTWVLSIVLLTILVLWYLCRIGVWEPLRSVARGSC